MVIQKNLRFWCQKVLPLVYDDSLSYYEVLCKIVDYINNLIKNDKEFADEIDMFRDEISEMQKAIDNMDVAYAEKIVQTLITPGVYFGLTDSGYFVAYIPGGWDKVNFKTTGYDTIVDLQPEYGHLVLLY